MTPGSLQQQTAKFCTASRQRSLYSGNAVFTNGAVADEERRVHIYYAACFTRLYAGIGIARRFR